MSPRSSRELRRRLKTRAPEPPPELLERLKGSIPEEQFPDSPGEEPARPSSPGWGRREWSIAAGLLAALASGLLAVRLGIVGREASVSPAVSEQAALADGTLEDGTLADGALADGALEERVLDDRVVEDRALEGAAADFVSPEPPGERADAAAVVAEAVPPGPSAESPASADENRMASARRELARELEVVAEAPRAEPLAAPPRAPERREVQDDLVAAPDAERQQKSAASRPASPEASAFQASVAEAEPVAARPSELGARERAAAAGSDAPATLVLEGVASPSRGVGSQGAVSPGVVTSGRWRIAGRLVPGAAGPPADDAAALTLRLVEAPSSDLAGSRDPVDERHSRASDADEVGSSRGLGAATELGTAGEFLLVVECAELAPRLATSPVLILEVVDGAGRPVALQRVEVPAACREAGGGR